jgi:hypothetical protein
MERRKFTREFKFEAVRLVRVRLKIHSSEQKAAERDMDHRLAEEARSAPIPQVTRIALGLVLNLGHTATIRWGPHPQLESGRRPLHHPFSNGLLDGCNAPRPGHRKDYT